MSEWAEFLSGAELDQVHRLESRIEADRADRTRIINRAYARMAREKARTQGIRNINERIAAE